MSGKTNLTRWLITVAISLGMGCTAFAAQVIYVDADAAGANDGTCWTDAYNYLQDALADANSAEKPVEIRVAQGIYKPDEGVGVTPGHGKATFRLVNGVAIRGGYAGFGEAYPNAWDIEAYETILSGDLAGNDIDVDDPRDLLDEPTRAENSCHVVTGKGNDVTAVLDGFTLTGGNARGWGHELGGGLFNSSGSPSIANCLFIGNCAREFGGGMDNTGSPTLTDCTFVGNSAGTLGGGMHNGGGTPSLKNCTFRDNSAGLVGGGMHNTSSPKLDNCRFSRNSAQSGGGMRNVFCSPLLTNCTFIGNSATHNGGGIDNQCWAGPVISNCVFRDNSAGDRGGGIYSTRSWVKVGNCSFSGNLADSGGAVSSHKSSVRFTNSILWGDAAANGPEIVVEEDSTVAITYSCIQGDQAAVYDPCEGLVWGDGNIDADPLFADPNNGDYHLKSQSGRWDRNTQSWVQDDVTSPCIDAGDPASRIGNETFPNGGVINMGAYGGTAEASKSYFGEPVCETIVAGDLNGDCRVDFLDLAVMSFHWLECGAPIRRIEVKDVKIIKGELLEHVDEVTGEVWSRFEPIEEVEQVRTGDVFTIAAEIWNFGGQTEQLYLTCYHLELHPEDHVEVVGFSRMGGCTGHLELERGESAVLYPLSFAQAFQAKEAGWVTVNIYVKDGVGHTFCEYPFRFHILPKQ